MNKLKLQEWAQVQGFRIINEDKAREHYDNYKILLYLTVLSGIIAALLVGAIIGLTDTTSHEPTLNVEIGGNVNLYFSNVQDNNGEIPNVSQKSTSATTRQAR